MTHGPHHPPTAWPWPSPRGCRRGATDGAHHSHRHGGATNPDGSLGPARPRPGTAASATPSSRTDASTRPRTPIPGFLLKRGRYTKFDAPDAVVQTVPFGINNRGVIVGKFTTADGVDHGFRRDARGTVHHHRRPRRRRDPAHQDQRPRPDRRVHSDTSPDLGDRPDSDPTAPTFKLRGFLLDRHGRFTRLDFPGSRSGQARSINDRGQVVGEYQDTAGSYHGYVWERGGFRTIDAPGAAGTSLFDSNDRGQLLGIRLQLDGTIRGFLLDRGRFTTFDGPGGPVTYAVGINEAGQIVGLSFDPADLTTISGFLRDARGRLSAINRPGAISTAPFGINNRGQIVGLAQAPGAAPGRQPEGHPPMGRMA
jgi:hypothetical protein